MSRPRLLDLGGRVPDDKGERMKDQVHSLPTEEQKRMVLEWAGFSVKATPEQDAHGRGLWHYPKYIQMWGEVPLDLNHLVIYVAVKLDYFEMKYAHKAPWVSVLIKHENEEYYGRHKEPAMALFWAIYNLVAKAEGEE